MQLTLNDLCVDVYDESVAARRRVVSDVSFRLDAGTALGITGESGSGKTTLSLALSGLLPAGSRASAKQFVVRPKSNESDERTADAAGELRPDRRIRALRGQRVFTLFQEPRASLNPHRTIGWQLDRCTSHGPNSRMSRSATAYDALRDVGLDPDVVRHYPHELSTGMCQRVFFAMASLLGSTTLIADEPFASVDGDTQLRLAALIREWVRSKGVGLVLVSHDLDLLRTLTDHMLVLYRGQVAESGPTSQVLESETPGHPYTWLLRAVNSSIGHSGGIDCNPSGLHTPVRCCFGDRCAWADSAACVDEVPELRVAESERSVENAAPSARRLRCVRHPVQPQKAGPDSADLRADQCQPEPEHKILDVRGVTKEFAVGWVRRRIHRVLNGLEFTVCAGERLGIVGPSGQGKTTLARVICGIVPQSHGQVQLAIRGRWLDTQQLSASDRLVFRRHIQMVYQDTDLVLDPASRIVDSLVEAYRVFDPSLDWDVAYRRAAQLLHELALPDGLLEAYPYRLSGGERKRVALARSLAAFGCPIAAAPDDPWRLLILDEPTAGVDVFLQAILRRFLLWVQRRLRLSYLVISHDADFVRGFCHRAMKLRDGQLAWDIAHVNALP